MDAPNIFEKPKKKEDEPEVIEVEVNQADIFEGSPFEEA